MQRIIGEHDRKENPFIRHGKSFPRYRKFGSENVLGSDRSQVNQSISYLFSIADVEFG
jgi:hypothetical protein